MKRFFLIVMVLVILGAMLGMFFFWRDETPDRKQITVPSTQEVPVIETRVVETPAPSIPVPVEKIPDTVLIAGVPFMVQAPLGQWQDPIYQDACEETSLTMARAWVQETALTQAGVTAEIAKLAAFEKKQFGHAIDTSIQDTAWLLENYHGITTGTVERDITIDTIKRALASEKIVIVPTDGRKLKNPNFKQPGPSRHMLVITGYESEAKEFIVNDPGTRKGEGYRYGEDVLYGALIDYETGEHVPLTSTDKVMLTVGREK